MVRWFIGVRRMENITCPNCSGKHVLGPYKRERDYDYPADRRIQAALDYYCTGCYKRFEVMV